MLRTVKESQSIALGIYNTNMSADERVILIYNLGGSSLDVAIISLQDQVFEVKATGGDTHLGGEDFLQRLIEYAHDEFKLQAGNTIDLRGDVRAM